MVGISQAVRINSELNFQQRKKALPAPLRAFEAPLHSKARHEAAAKHKDAATVAILG